MLFRSTATVPSGAVPTPIRSSLNPADKSLIGRMAAEEVADGDTIFIDSGTTTLCLLRYLVAKNRITIITHSLGALSEAAKYENMNIISLGGIYSPTTDSFVEAFPRKVQICVVSFILSSPCLRSLPPDRALNAPGSQV